jgi:hypothetical protein
MSYKIVDCALMNHIIKDYAWRSVFRAGIMPNKISLAMCQPKSAAIRCRSAA